MKPVLLIRNDEYESFGLAPNALAWERLDVRTVDLTSGAPPPPLEEVSGVIAFGGTANVDQVHEYPYLAQVREYTCRALDRQVPYLGICLGSQILARALDVPVVKGPVREVGFEPLRPTEDAGADPLLSLYRDGDVAVQWHEDTYELPEGATLLATGDRIPVQAYRVGDHAWGIQFHQEVDALEFSWWIELASSQIDLEATWGKSPARLRAEAEEHMAAHERRGVELFRRFARLVRERA